MYMYCSSVANKKVPRSIHPSHLPSVCVADRASDSLVLLLDWPRCSFLSWSGNGTAHIPPLLGPPHCFCHTGCLWLQLCWLPRAPLPNGVSVCLSAVVLIYIYSQIACISRIISIAWSYQTCFNFRWYSTHVYRQKFIDDENFLIYSTWYMLLLLQYYMPWWRVCPSHHILDCYE